MNRTSSLQGLLAALLPIMLLAGLTACSLPLLERPTGPEEILTYTLEWAPADPIPPAPANGPTLAISPPLAAAGYGSSEMRYMVDRVELKAFAWHRWADAPARLLEPLLVTAAEASGLFAAVVPPGTPGATDLRLDSRLLHLRQVFEAGGCRMEMALRVTLVDNRSARILGTRELRESLPCDSPDPRGGALTANRLVGRLMGQLQGFLGEHLPRLSPF